jgi:hypothetical protein
MKKHYLLIKTLVLASALSLSGSLSAAASIESSAPYERVAVEKENPSAARTLSQCAMDRWPEMAVMGGLIIANPVAGILGGVYYGGSVFKCREDSLKFEKIMADLKEQTQSDLAELYSRLKTKKAAAADQDLESTSFVQKTEGQIEAAGAKERALLERLNNKLMREMYIQIEAIKNSEFEMKEKRP